VESPCSACACSMPSRACSIVSLIVVDPVAPLILSGPVIL
jgi:hypothetical protein